MIDVTNNNLKINHVTTSLSVSEYTFSLTRSQYITQATNFMYTVETTGLEFKVKPVKCEVTQYDPESTTSPIFSDIIYSWSTSSKTETIVQPTSALSLVVPNF